MFKQKNSSFVIEYEGSGSYRETSLPKADYSAAHWTRHVTKN